MGNVNIKKDKRTINILQNIIQKTKNRATQNPLKTGGMGNSERKSSSCSNSGTRRE